MQKFNIVISQRAKKDLIDIGDYITYTLLEPNIALNLIKSLRSQIQKLKELPKRIPLINDEVLSSQGIRCLSHNNYYVFYKVDDKINTVYIIRVGFNRRDWKKILDFTFV